MITLPSKQPEQYTSSRQLISGADFNNVVAQLNSSARDITARAGGGQARATQLNAANNILGTVVTAADSVKLPKGINGLEVWIQNAGASNAQVFTYGTGTINNTDGVATGVVLAPNAASATMYKCINVNAQTGAETWVTK